MRFSEANNLPVATSFRCQDYIDNRHPLYCGHAGIGLDPGMGERIRGADLLICVGARLGEITTGGYRLLDIPNPRMKLVHVHPGAEAIGEVYRPDLPVNSTSPSFARAVRELQLPQAERWGEWARETAELHRAGRAPRSTPGAIQLEHVVTRVRARLPDEAIVCNGAGNYAAWVNRYFEYRRYRTQLAPTSGSMGYGVPAAVAARIVHPDRPVVCFAGDGCFLMTGQELATAALYALDITFIVANNSMYGTIRMHQERHYPARVHGTGLRNPDFAMLARSYGGHGVRVESNEAFDAALEEALARPGINLIEAVLDPNALSPAATLEEVRAEGLARRARHEKGVPA